MVATSLGTCMLTIMGIKARSMDFDLDDSTVEVEKIMTSAPRRIAEVRLAFKMKGTTDKEIRLLLERVARTCPVAKSLHPDVIQTINFNWED